MATLRSQRRPPPCGGYDRAFARCSQFLDIRDDCVARLSNVAQQVGVVEGAGDVQPPPLLPLPESADAIAAAVAQAWQLQRIGTGVRAVRRGHPYRLGRCLCWYVAFVRAGGRLKSLCDPLHAPRSVAQKHGVQSRPLPGADYSDRLYGSPPHWPLLSISTSRAKGIGSTKRGRRVLHRGLGERAGLQGPMPDRVAARIMNHPAQLGSCGSVDVEVEIQCSHERSPVHP